MFRHFNHFATNQLYFSICQSTFAIQFASKYCTSAWPVTTKLGIIGVPFAKGQPKKGVENAPKILRQAGLYNLLQETSTKGQLMITKYNDLTYTIDANDLGQYQEIHNYAEFIGCNKSLIKKVQQILNENDQFLVIGGDHAIGFGSVAGHLLHTPNLSLVWVDAHADINIHGESLSGNAHGMPVSLLLEQLRSHWQRGDIEAIAPKRLKSNELAYIGLRDVDTYERFLLKKLNILYYTMPDVDRYGIHKIMEIILDRFNVDNKIHLSFDVDALDPIWALSTGTAVPGGLTLLEGKTIVDALRATNRLEGIDIVEINPNIGAENDVAKTLNSSFEILKSIFS